MKKQLLATLIFLTLLAVLTLGTISAAAQATRTEFYSQEVLAPIGPPGKLWVSDGILHAEPLREGLLQPTVHAPHGGRTEARI